MTQIASLPPAAPQLPPAGPPPASSGSQQFSSHFDKAIASRETPASKPDTSQTPEKKPATSRDEAGEKTAPPGTKDHEPATAGTAGPEETPPKQDPAAAQSVETYPAANISLPLVASVAATPTAATPIAAPPPGQEQTAALVPTIVSPTGSPIAMPPVLAEETKTATTSPTDTLLAQIRTLIENSDEVGTVSITRQPASTTPASAETVLSPQAAWQPLENPLNVAMVAQYSRVVAESPPAVPAAGGNPPAEVSDQATSLRQNLQQQYFEAKINLQPASKDEGAQAQDRQQGNEAAAQSQVGAGQTAALTTTLTGEQTSTFVQSLAAAQTPAAQPATDTAKTLTLPSGAVVREGEVMQQVLERFQVSHRPLDTQINIKLHPAELGELKIDLTVKEGSIRANVVAQSQHAQEIIEKNMPKLRSVLEDQGFTVEHITVSSKYDSTTDAGLFDRQLFSQNEYTPSANKRRHDNDVFRLDEAFFPTQPPAAGVNVKI